MITALTYIGTALVFFAAGLYAAMPKLDGKDWTAVPFRGLPTE
jgi:hypothetical protein